MVWRDGKLWFFLVDVCAALEIANVSNVAARLSADEKDTVTIADGQGGPDRTIISRPGLAKVLGTSNKPIAKEFDRWVRHDVLEEIAETGAYKMLRSAFASRFCRSPQF